MKEIKGDLWDYYYNVKHRDTYVCITTNGFIKKDGSAVMGKGCAAEAAKRFPDLPYVLGKHIRENGNVVGILSTDCTEDCILTFPVKHRWWEDADLILIAKSAKALKQEALRNKNNTYILPRPGCGNGRLTWKVVKPVLTKILPDNVAVITFPEQDKA